MDKQKDHQATNKSTKTNANQSLPDQPDHTRRRSPLKVALPIIAVVIVIAALFGAAYFIKHQSANSDVATTEQQAERNHKEFAKQYPDVPESNLFVYRSASQIIDILEHGTGLVFLSFPECPWCQAYAPYLNEVAQDYQLDKIYYFNIYEDRKNNTADYQKMVTILSDYLQYDEEGQPRIYVPDVVLVIDGQIIDNDYETSLDTAGAATPADYWTEERANALKLRLSSFAQLLKNHEASCADVCNE